MRHTRLYHDGVLEAEDFPAAKISDCLQQPGTVVWLDLCEPDQEDLELVSEEFGLHPLAVEDAVQQHERPKLDRYQDHYFLTAYAVSLDTTLGQPLRSVGRPLVVRIRRTQGSWRSRHSSTAAES